MSAFKAGVVARNPAWVQLLGLCPLLAVSNSLTNAIGLALASTFVLLGSNTLISILRKQIPQFARLPVFMLIIASFTTLAVMGLEAYAYPLYLSIALFVQIIVTNCMILARAESFAAHQPLLPSLADALGTATGFAIALVALGGTRELLATGAIAGISLLPENFSLPIAALPPGAFIVAGLLLGLGQAVFRRGMRDEQKQTG